MNQMQGLVLDPNSPSKARLATKLEKPKPKKGEVLVRIANSTVNGHEFEMAREMSFRLFQLLKRAKGEVRTGLEFSGTVVSDGTTFSNGDRVMGYVEMIAGWKPHAEFIAIPEEYIAHLPDTLSFVDASTLPMSGMSALQAIRLANVSSESRVLVVGAGGGVGVLAVQIAARVRGAAVSAVATNDQSERLMRLGAKEVFDYRETPVTDLSGPFDAVIDLTTSLFLRDVRAILSPKGKFIPANPIRNIADIIFSSQAEYLWVDRGNSEALQRLIQWVSEGSLHPVVDRAFSLSEWEDAIQHAHERGQFGRTVLAFE